MKDLENVSSISLRLENVSTGALMRPEQRLAPAQRLQIGEILANMVQAYPHQDLAESMGMYQRGLEILAVEFGMAPLQRALESIFTHENFFPHPSEVRKVLEEMAKQKAQELNAALPKIGCDVCMPKDEYGHRDGFAGFVYTPRPGLPPTVVPCECRLARAKAKKALEAKA